MRIKKMITKGELRPVLKQFLPTSTVRNALGQIRRICMLILGNKGLSNPFPYRVLKRSSISFMRLSNEINGNFVHCDVLYNLT